MAAGLVSPLVDAADQTDPSRDPRPAPLVLLLLAALETASVDSERLSLGVSTAIFFALTGAAVLGCAWGLLRLASWARGPLLLAQLIALGLAWNLKDAPLVALVLVGCGLVALAGMLPEEDPQA